MPAAMDLCQSRPEEVPLLKDNSLDGPLLETAPNESPRRCCTCRRCGMCCLVLLPLLVGILFVLWCALCPIEKKLVFQPYFPGIIERRPQENPHHYGMEYDNVTLESLDGTKLNSWFMYHSDEVVPTVIFFHGNFGHIAMRLPFYEFLYKSAGANVFALEYRGYGDSEGTPSENGIYEDTEAALDLLRGHPRYRGGPIIALGNSIGGVFAIHLAAKRNTELAGLITINTLTSIIDVVLANHPYLRFIGIQKWLCIHLNSISKISAVSIPSLFIVGQNDKLIPPTQSEELHKACQAKSTIVKVPNADHNGTWMMPLAKEAMISFIRDSMPPKPSHTKAHTSSS